MTSTFKPCQDTEEEKCESTLEWQEGFLEEVTGEGHFNCMQMRQCIENS